MIKRSTHLLVALAASLVPPAAPAQVGPALQRAALMVRQPQRSVLLSVAKAGERIVAVGERGVIVLSDDGGASWRQAPCPVSVTLTMVRFADARHGVAVGHGATVLTTSDAGATWAVRLDGKRVAQQALQAARTPEAKSEAERLVADGPDKPFLDVLVWDASRMLAVGAYGIAFHTTDGGASWTPWMGRLPNPKALHWYIARRAGGTVLLAGEQGLIARSGDEGETFSALASPYPGSWFSGELDGDGRMLLAGLRGNVWRYAGGAGWTQIASPMQASITATAPAADGSMLLANQAGFVLQMRGGSLRPLNRSPLPMPAALLPSADGSVLTVGIAGVQPLTVRAASAGAKP